VIFPTDDAELEDRVRYLIERCLSTREERDRLYQWREKYYLFGTQGYEQAKYNRLESHLDLVTSFLYAPDHAFYHISADQNADEQQVQRATVLQLPVMEPKPEAEPQANPEAPPEAQPAREPAETTAPAAA